MPQVSSCTARHNITFCYAIHCFSAITYATSSFSQFSIQLYLNLQLCFLFPCCSAAGEMLTFSLTDYHIITQSSGFGRVGAWLSGRWGNLFELAPGQWVSAVTVTL
jgi:hypothetical protein